MAANDTGSRLAPPTSAPSISSCAIRPLTLSGFTLPPYRMRQASAAVGPELLADLPADEGVRARGDLGRGHFAGSDGPTGS